MKHALKRKLSVVRGNPEILRTHPRGQAVLLGSFLLLIIMLSIPPLIFRHIQTTRTGIAAQRTQEAGGGSEDGIHYAVHELSDPAVWSAAVGGFFPTVCTSTFTTPSGLKFQIGCRRGDSGMTDYQIKILSKAVTRNSAVRSLQAIVSPQTVGVVLPYNVPGSAALQLQNVPSVAGDLVVHWGPIVVLDTMPWTLNGTMDQYRFPRKFSQGAITGSYPSIGSPSFPRSPTSNNPPFTDQSEYWAFQNLGFISSTDDIYYLGRATSSLQSEPGCSGGCSGVASPSGSGHFTPGPLGTLVADESGGGGGNGYAAGASNNVIVVDGNMQWGRIALDMVNGGAVIVNGNLILDGNGAGGLNLTSVRVPPTAKLEYPDPSACPCSDNAGGTCLLHDALPGHPHGKVDFRGFLHVKGNLTITGGHQWLLVGAVRVDGTLTIPADSTLTILYDDQVNHLVRVQSNELQIESLTELR